MPKKSSMNEIVEEPQENPFLEYNNKTYQSYVKNGFADEIPHGVESPERRMKGFISRVDMTKDFQWKIMTMTRLMTKNYLSDSKKKNDLIDVEVRQENISVGWGPSGVAVDTSVNLVYVTNFLSNDISIINGSDNKVIGNIKDILKPWFIDVNPETHIIVCIRTGMSPVHTMNFLL
jgi:YVTN family beta-propeller protein